MAGIAAPSELKRRAGELSFAVAGRDDDASLRRLLRENPMAGPISVSLEREPNFFIAAGVEGDEHQSIVCRDDNGRLLGMGTRAVRTTLHQARTERTGYLSQLRLDRSARGGYHVVTRGYRLLRELHELDGRTRIYLTSILEHSTPARRLLEAGIRGLPTYRPIDRFETSIISTPARLRAQGVEVRTGRPREECLLADLICECNGQFRFAHAWDAQSIAALATLGLPIDRFIIAERNGSPVACAAVWDQGAFKQSVIRGYSQAMRLARPFLNLVARPLDFPHLPATGCEIALQYLSHVACKAGEEHAFRAILSAAVALSRRERCSLVTGFSRRHPLAPVVRTFRRRAVTSILYAVSWPDGDEAAAAMSDSTIHTEVALL